MTRLVLVLQDVPGRKQDRFPRVKIFFEKKFETFLKFLSEITNIIRGVYSNEIYSNLSCFISHTAYIM